MERPALTELEQLKLENIALKYRTLEQQKQELIQARILIVRQIESRLPGWKWRDPDGLVPDPETEEQVLPA